MWSDRATEELQERSCFVRIVGLSWIIGQPDSNDWRRGQPLPSAVFRAPLCAQDLHTWRQKTQAQQAASSLLQLFLVTCCLLFLRS